MPVNNDRLQYLFQQFAAKKCSKEELQELYQIVEQTGDEEMHELMDAHFSKINDKANTEKVDWEYMFRDIVKQKKAAPVRQMWWRIAVAAAVIILIAAGTYFFVNKDSKNDIVKKENTAPANDVGPGGNKAVLTLDDNSEIILDNSANGTLTQRGNTKILKLDDGQLAYSADGQTGEVRYNTITTPRGGKYEVVLSDGTKVWLNAASSLRFPIAFVGKERKVELKGEAYFEVAKNKDKPFKVITPASQPGGNDLNMEVLGTHFNVMAYKDEKSIQTTLLEGALKVYTGNQVVMLSPGLQAELNNNGKIRINKDVDVQEVVAWKNGMFQFSRASIEDIMRQISRWYNVDIAYEGKITKETFSGIVSRNSNASQVLKIMEQAGVKFKIEGSRITVL